MPNFISATPGAGGLRRLRGPTDGVTGLVDFGLAAATFLTGALTVFATGLATGLVVAAAFFFGAAALLGAACVVAGDLAGLPSAPVAVAGAVACFLLRYFAIRRGWRLPVAGSR